MRSLYARIAALVLRVQGKAAQADRASVLAAVDARRKTDRAAPSRRWRRRYDVGIDDVHGHPCFTIAPRVARDDRSAGPPDLVRNGATNAAAGPRVLYLHGGCYTFEITKYHWDFIGALVDRAGATVTVPIYPLAPEHDHREAFAMLEPLARDLARAGDLAIIGDSAGGGLALALAQHVTAHATPPRATILLSPWVDIALADPAIAALERADVMLSRGGLVAAGEMWANGAPEDDPRVSPIHGAMALPTPVTIFIGTDEVLLPDCRRLTERLRAAGTRVDYIEARKMFHVWPLVTRLPEARLAIDRIVRALA